ncbi:hypothetical protein AURDEDRAFT_165502 [Auricularia subglabra TFB-10046 SS5]|nr:hypothetical protein AURDEDRAFT_165502 [Auricularia subglabra TFB-10046 SS5]
MTATLIIQPGLHALKKLKNYNPEDFLPRFLANNTIDAAFKRNAAPEHHLTLSPSRYQRRTEHTISLQGRTQSAQPSVIQSTCNVADIHGLEEGASQAAPLIINNIDILTIQEPWWTEPSATLTANNNWVHVMPPTPAPDTVMLVNKAILTDRGAPKVIGNGADYTEFRVWTSAGTSIAIYNIDDDQTGSLLELEWDMDSDDNDDYILWLGDFNARHGVWKPDGNDALYPQCAHAANDSCSSSLTLTALPPGIGPFITRHTANSPSKRTRPDGVFASPSPEERVVSCDTREDWVASAADHLPIITELDPTTDYAEPAGRPNWYAGDWDKFIPSLEAGPEAGPPR